MHGKFVFHVDIFSPKIQYTGKQMQLNFFLIFGKLFFNISLENLVRSGNCSWSVIPVDTLLLVGNMDPEITLEMVSMSAEFVSR